MRAFLQQDLASQPQAGAASQPAFPPAASQPHAGAAAASQPHAGAASQPLSQPHLGFLQQLPKFKFKSGLRQQDFFLQQLFASQPQAGAASQPPPAASQPQAGAAASQPQAGFASQQEVSQPHPLIPSIRSSNSKPKLWVLIAMPSTNDPIRMFHFIEPRLLNVGTC